MPKINKYITLAHRRTAEGITLWFRPPFLPMTRVSHVTEVAQQVGLLTNTSITRLTNTRHGYERVTLNTTAIRVLRPRVLSSIEHPGTRCCTPAGNPVDDNFSSSNSRPLDSVSYTKSPGNPFQKLCRTI